MRARFMRRPSLAALALALGGAACQQPLDIAASQGQGTAAGGASGGGGHTVALETPVIELDDKGTTTADPCAATRLHARAILTANCARCHSGDTPGAHRGQPPFDFVLDVPRLSTAVSATAIDPVTKTAARFLTPGKATQSRVYLRVAGGEMPPRDVVGLPPSPRPTISDVSVLEAWIARCIGGP